METMDCGLGKLWECSVTEAPSAAAAWTLFSSFPLFCLTHSSWTPPLRASGAGAAKRALTSPSLTRRAPPGYLVSVAHARDCTFFVCQTTDSA